MERVVGRVGSDLKSTTCVKCDSQSYVSYHSQSCHSFTPYRARVSWIQSRVTAHGSPGTNFGRHAVQRDCTDLIVTVRSSDCDGEKPYIFPVIS